MYNWFNPKIGQMLTFRQRLCRQLHDFGWHRYVTQRSWPDIKLAPIRKLVGQGSYGIPIYEREDEESYQKRLDKLAISIVIKCRVCGKVKKVIK